MPSTVKMAIHRSYTITLTENEREELLILLSQPSDHISDATRGNLFFNLEKPDCMPDIMRAEIKFVITE
jgi:hypothetical protein